MYNSALTVKSLSYERAISVIHLLKSSMFGPKHLQN